MQEEEVYSKKCFETKLFRAGDSDRKVWGFFKSCGPVVGIKEHKTVNKQYNNQIAF